RAPLWGSNHQKFLCCGGWTILGSADFAKSRWGCAAHAPENSCRPGKPTHEVALRIDGPAAADVHQTFAERWNDRSTRFAKPIETSTGGQHGMGPHSVQILRTYGMTSLPSSYSWSRSGEFTIWASYLNAIKTARDYIYIEDQSFFLFHHNHFPESDL